MRCTVPKIKVGGYVTAEVVKNHELRHNSGRIAEGTRNRQSFSSKYRGRRSRTHNKLVWRYVNPEITATDCLTNSKENPTIRVRFLRSPTSVEQSMAISDVCGHRIPNMAAMKPEVV
jgi:hypothetical protein